MFCSHVEFLAYTASHSIDKGGMVYRLIAVAKSSSEIDSSETLPLVVLLIIYIVLLKSLLFLLSHYSVFQLHRVMIDIDNVLTR